MLDKGMKTILLRYLIIFAYVAVKIKNSGKRHPTVKKQSGFKSHDITGHTHLLFSLILCMVE